MHDKKKVIMIIFIIILCLIGIGVYAKDFTKVNKISKNDEKREIKTIENKTNFNVKKLDGTIAKEKVKTIKECTNILGENDKKHPIVLREDKIFVKDDDGKEEVIRKLPSGGAITLTCGDKDVIAWMEKENKKIGDENFTANCIYCYNIKDKSITKIAENIYIKDSEGIYSETCYLADCIKIHDNKVYYAMTEQKEEKLLRKIYMYNPENKKSIEVYTDDNTDHKLSSDILTFDIDYDKGYLFYQRCVHETSDGTDKSCLFMVNMNKKSNNKKVLAVSEKGIQFSVKYPYAAFFVNEKVHLYNIEKGYDDACIQCNSSDIYGVDISEDKVIFSNSKVYCYFIKDKKLYSFSESDKNIESTMSSFVTGDNICWFSDGSIHYVKLNDID